MKATYRLGKKDSGRRISVRLVRRKAGYTTLTLVSKAVRVRASR